MFFSICIVVFIASIVGFLLLQLVKIVNLKRQFAGIPGPPCASFIYGNTDIVARYKREGKAFMHVLFDLTLQYGDVFVFWTMLSPFVFISNPEAVKTFCSDIKTFTKNKPGKRFFRIDRIGGTRFVGQNSILSDTGGPIWEHKKRILDQAFKITKLQSHIPKLYLIAEKVAARMELYQDEYGFIDVAKAIGPFTIDAISTAGFSVRNEKTLSELKQGLTTVAMYFESMIKAPITTRLLHSYFGYKMDYEKEATVNLRTIRDVGKKIVMQRMQDGTFGSVNDALDFIISANQDESGNVDMENCMDDFMTMYEAGNITTSTTLGYALAEIIRNPDVAEELQKEVDVHWSGVNKNSTSEEIVEILRKMTYLEALVYETLRKWPPAPAASRTLAKDMTICGYQIKKDTNVMISQYVMHRHPQYWDEPCHFNPQRFLDKDNLQNYTFFPFLMGPRRCLGKNFALLEIKIFLAHWISRFIFEKVEGKTTKEIEAKQALVFRPVNNYVQLKRRHAKQ